MLGHTLPEIAFEKAGIIKPEVPVIIGESLPETRPVFIEKASKESASIIFAQEERYVVDFKSDLHLLTVEVVSKHNDTHETYQLDLPGVYQTKNLVTVLEAAYQLQKLGYNTTISIVKKAIPHVKRLTGLHGRWELIHTNPNVIVDVAHNVDGINQLVEQIELCNYNHLHIIIGMAKDKDIDSVLALLPRLATYYFTKAQIPRALDEHSLKEKGRKLGLEGSAYPTVKDALQTAKANTHKDDLLIVCGSVFVVGEIMTD